MIKLQSSFYSRSDTLQVSKELLGKHLVTQFDGLRTSGMIVETEAYLGKEDRACHAWNGRRTARTEVMYAPGGTAYVYLCYGIHHLFNVVTHAADVPHAVLIRAVEPVDGLPEMLRRRKKTRLERSLTAGPGALSGALGILTSHTGLSLLGDQIWLEDHGYSWSEEDVVASPRVGVGYAGEDALLPYRFRLRHSVWTSPAK